MDFRACSSKPAERFFNNIEQCRRIATRHDRLAANDPTFIKPASIRGGVAMNLRVRA
jgi:transposase